MKRLLQTVLAIPILFFSFAYGSNIVLDNKIKRMEKSAIIVVWDIVSLNHPKASELFNKNFEQYKKDFTKKSFRKLNVKQVEYLIMGQTTRSSMVIAHRKSKKVYKESKKAINTLRDEIELIDTSKVGKDIVSTIEQVNMLVDERYKEFDHVITVFYSNFRQTVNLSKIKQLKSINLDPKISKMIIFANSGLQYTSNVSSSQILKANENVKSFFMNRLPKDKVLWFSNY